MKRTPKSLSIKLLVSSSLIVAGSLVNLTAHF